jgi:tetratricopeptide (TPR) repeat protein
MTRSPGQSPEPRSGPKPGADPEPESQERARLLAEGVRWREQGRLDDALARMLDLSARYPEDAAVAYQTAWIHDRMGLESAALPHYRRAIASDGLDPQDRLGALTGCGSTLRVLGRYKEAAELLAAAVEEFPEDGALQAFLAMALHNLGRSDEAVTLLLRLLASSSTAPNIQAYRTAIEYYAQNLDLVEPSEP